MDQWKNSGQPTKRVDLELLYISPIKFYNCNMALLLIGQPTDWVGLDGGIFFFDKINELD